MSGLEGVVVADTSLSEVDGERGRLLIVGHDVRDVAAVGFAGACGLLWDGGLPDPERRAEIERALAAAREQAWSKLDSLGDALYAPDAMDGLRAAVAHLHVDGASRADPAWPHDAALLTGATAVFASAWARIASGATPIAPSATCSHAADYLRMVRGRPGRDVEQEGISRYLATVCEHGMNASTFAARTVASTEADTVSAVVAGIGALKGRLHGGAPGPVLDMLDAIGVAQQAESWIEGALARGERVMGMGHRVYRARDPRADVLERAVRALDASSGRVELAREVEAQAERLLRQHKPGRALRANVEFYTAVLLEALGVPRTLFTATFAVGRVAGWCAHIQEQRRNGRLIRPRARYVGTRPAA